MVGALYNGMRLNEIGFLLQGHQEVWSHLLNGTFGH